MASEALPPYAPNAAETLLATGLKYGDIEAMTDTMGRRRYTSQTRPYDSDSRPAKARVWRGGSR